MADEQSAEDIKAELEATLSKQFEEKFAEDKANLQKTFNAQLEEKERTIQLLQADDAKSGSKPTEVTKTRAELETEYARQDSEKKLAEAIAERDALWEAKLAAREGGVPNEWLDGVESPAEIRRTTAMWRTVGAQTDGDSNNGVKSAGAGSRTSQPKTLKDITDPNERMEQVLKNRGIADISNIPTAKKGE